VKPDLTRSSVFYRELRDALRKRGTNKSHAKRDLERERSKQQQSKNRNLF